jgi:hypothetical protein
MINHDLRWRDGLMGYPASGPRHSCQTAEALVTVIEGAQKGESARGLDRRRSGVAEGEGCKPRQLRGTSIEVWLTRQPFAWGQS